jgi:hypothetical protein
MLRMLRLAAEDEEAAVAILDDEFAGVPGSVVEEARDLDAACGVFGVERVDISDEEVGVDEFLRIFVRIGCGRRGAAEMDGVLVARDDGVDRRFVTMLTGVGPCAETLEAELVLVIGEGGGNIQSEENRNDLANQERASV